MDVFIDKLRHDISDNSIKIIPINTGGGSYSIKYMDKHRIARVQELKKIGKYKCTCDSEKSRRLFDKIKSDYVMSPGFEYRSSDYNVLYLESSDDMRSFLLKVISGYVIDG